MLVFGDEKHTVLVNGIYPASARDLKAAINAAVMSVQYDSTRNDDPLDAVKSASIRPALPQLAKYIAGSLIYTGDGKIPSETPSLIISNTIAKKAPDDRKQFAIDRLHQLPGAENYLIKEILPLIINGMDGVETTAAGINKEGHQELIYQVILFAGNGDYFIMVGVAKEDFDKNLDMFKSVAKTFRLKTGGFFKAG